MKVICSAFITIIDMNDITSSNTPPSNPTDGMLWMDTSVTPPVLKVWQNGKWEIQGDETVGTSNLLKNTGLRKDTTHWSLSSGITRDVIKKKGDNCSFKYQVTGLTADAWRSANPTTVEVDLYKRYSAACEVYIPSSHNIDSGVALEVQWFDESGSRIKTDRATPNLSLTNRWQRVTIERLRVPSGAVKMNARVWIGRNGTLYVAELMLAEGAKIGSWVAHKDDIMDEVDDSVNDAIIAQTQEEIFNKLTNNGQSQGIFMDEDKNFYINGEYIRGENLNIVRHSDKKSTLKVDSVGEIEINAKKLSIQGSGVATSGEVTNAVSNTVVSVDVMYYLSTSSSSLVGGSWSTTAPTWVNGKFMWSKTVTTLKSGSVVESDPTCIAGASGADGKGIKSIVEQYYHSTSMTSMTGGSWSTSVPTPVSGKYIWTRSVITYTDNTTTTTAGVCTTGSKGDTGATGPQGPAGANAQYMIVTGEQVFKYTNNFSGTPSPSQIALTAQATGITSPSYQWSYRVPGSTSVTNISGATSSSFTLTHNNSIWGSHKQLTLRCTSSGKYDEITIVKVSDGSPGANGTNGTNGTNGADAYTIVLTNESHTFPAENNGNISTALTTTSDIIAYKGATRISSSVGAVTNPSGLSVSASSNGTTSTRLNITATTGTSLSDTGSVVIPITVDGKVFNKTFSWAKAKKGNTGATGSQGPAGTNAKLASIIPSSMMFKSTDGGITFAPDEITLTPKLQNVSFSNWQYSVNGGSSWTTVTSGQNGLTISSNALKISKNSALYTKTITAVSFRLNTNDSSIYDVVTVAKLYDPNEMTQEQVFNKLTNGGTTQGIYLENNKVYLNGQYIKTDTLKADQIISGTFQGTNFVAGGNKNGDGYISVLSGSNDILFKANKDGLYAKNIVFATTSDYNYKTDGYYWADGYGFHGEAAFDDGTLNSWQQSYSANIDGISIKKTGEYQVNTGIVTLEPHQLTLSDTYSTQTSVITPSEITTGTLVTRGNIESKGFINSSGNITSHGGIFGTTFIQHSANYGTPLEVGRYIDLHNTGSTNDVDVRLDTGGTRDRLRISGGADLSRYVEIGMNSNGSFLKDSPSGKFLQMRTDRLTYDGSTVPHNWRQSFTPFLYSDTGTFTTSSAVGQAVYLGDLVFVQGRVIAKKGSHSGGVAIGGLPVSNSWNYPPVTIGFFGGVTDAMNSLTYGINGYVESGAGHIVLNFTLRNANWQQLQCVHLGTGNVDVNFSAVYRWR